MNAAVPDMRDRFRVFLPVVVDVETGGFNAATDALLEIAAVLVEIVAEGRLVRGATHRQHVKPFEGGRLDPASLAVNGIDPYHPLRIASTESDALGAIFGEVRRAVREQQCTRAILVGHNASFDLGFLNAAVARAGIRRNPFERQVEPGPQFHRDRRRHPEPHVRAKHDAGAGRSTRVEVGLARQARRDDRGGSAAGRASA